MQEKTELKLMFYFTLVYILFFTVLSIIKNNYEFLYYTFIMAVLIFLIILYHKKLHLSIFIFLGLTVLGLLHMLGGSIYLFGTRLYDFWLIPPNIFKYDNLIHSFAIFVTTFVVYSLLNPHLDKKIEHNPGLISLLLVSIAMGIGAFNEVIELGAVVFFNAAKGVGDYMNNALDLLFNLIGSILASIFIIRYHLKNKKAK